MRYKIGQKLYQYCFLYDNADGTELRLSECKVIDIFENSEYRYMIEGISHLKELSFTHKPSRKSEGELDTYWHKSKLKAAKWLRKSARQNQAFRLMNMKKLFAVRRDLLADELDRLNGEKNDQR